MNANAAAKPGSGLSQEDVNSFVRGQIALPQRRVIAAETRILDATKGIVQYVASDETLDSYNEVIRVKGWRFNLFKKNNPFVDSHDYETIEKLLGSVIDFQVKGGELIETVQWAIDVPENRLAQLGWKMTVGGFLRAVSVGFQPTKWVSKWDKDPSNFYEQAQELKLSAEAVRVIYLEQEQIELSAVILGANPNALAKARAAGVLNDSDVQFFNTKSFNTEATESTEGHGEEFLGTKTKSENASTTDVSGRVVDALDRTLEAGFQRRLIKELIKND